MSETTSPLTASGEGLGTAGFSAPEVYDVDAHQVDERADVYSVGRIAAWLVTGRWPRPNHPLTPEGELRGWVLECTDLAPDRRPGSITEALERLKELTSEPTTSSRGAIQEILERTPLPLEDAYEVVYRQILQGLTSAVQGLAELRSKLGDAHGRGRVALRACPRHARMAAGAAATVATFLVETLDQRRAASHPGGGSP